MEAGRSAILGVLAAGDRVHGLPVFLSLEDARSGRTLLVELTSILVRPRQYVNENRYHSRSMVDVIA
jgi:hypothetical protein